MLFAVDLTNIIAIVPFHMQKLGEGSSYVNPVD